MLIVSFLFCLIRILFDVPSCKRYFILPQSYLFCCYYISDIDPSISSINIIDKWKPILDIRSSELL